MAPIVTTGATPTWFYTVTLLASICGLGLIAAFGELPTPAKRIIGGLLGASFAAYVIIDFAVYCSSWAGWIDVLCW